MRVIAIPKIGNTKILFCDSVAILDFGENLICYKKDSLNSVFKLEHYENIIIDDSNMKWYDILNWNELKETYGTLPNHIKEELVKSGKAPKDDKIVVEIKHD
jgi:hypothetical protein